MKNIERYFQKNNISVEHIIYAYCEKQNLIICLDSSLVFNSSILMHELKEFLPMDDFIEIRRGTIAKLNAIVSISDEGIYTMMDGKKFQGRKRYLSEHKKLRKELQLNYYNKSSIPLIREQQRIPLSLLEKCSLLDNMQLAFCIIELVFDDNGHGIDFIFRYCNKQMEIVEGVPIEEMIDHSFYEVFKNGDKKWLVAYADVALNGVQRIIHDYSPEVDKNLTIYCYQPEPRYCACVLLIE